MREYEILYLVRSATPEKEINEVSERLARCVQTQKGKIFFARNWGRRTLSYPIQKQKDGVYLHLDFAGTGEMVAEMERVLRLDERVVRFLTVQLDDAVDIAKREQELEALAAAAAAAALAPPATEDRNTGDKYEKHS